MKHEIAISHSETTYCDDFTFDSLFFTTNSSYVTLHGSRLPVSFQTFQNSHFIVLILHFAAHVVQFTFHISNFLLHSLQPILYCSHSHFMPHTSFHCSHFIIHTSYFKVKTRQLIRNAWEIISHRLYFAVHSL